MCCPPQLLENQAAVTEAAQHGHPDVHSGLGHVRPDPPVRLLAVRLGPQHGQGAALPLLRQEGHQVHHQVAGVPPAAGRVPAPLQDAHGGAAQALAVPLRLKLRLQQARPQTPPHRYETREARIHLALPQCKKIPNSGKPLILELNCRSRIKELVRFFKSCKTAISFWDKAAALLLSSIISQIIWYFWRQIVRLRLFSHSLETALPLVHFHETGKHLFSQHGARANRIRASITLLIDSDL